MCFLPVPPEVLGPPTPRWPGVSQGLHSRPPGTRSAVAWPRSPPSPSLQGSSLARCVTTRPPRSHSCYGTWNSTLLQGKGARRRSWDSRPEARRSQTGRAPSSLPAEPVRRGRQRLQARSRARAALLCALGARSRKSVMGCRLRKRLTLAAVGGRTGF